MRMRRGKACVEGSVAGGILEDRHDRGGCSTTRIVRLGAFYDGREGEYEGYWCHGIPRVDAIAVFPQRFIPSKQVMTDCERHCISIYSKPTPPT